MQGRWLYEQVFHDPGPLGTRTDEILMSYVRPTATALTASGSIDRFFFLRYGDPQYHVRYRLRLVSEDQTEFAIKVLHDAAQRVSPPIRRELHEYEPELVKYGGLDRIAIVEKLFHLSSELSLDCIARSCSRSLRRTVAALCAFELMLEFANISGLGRVILLEGSARYWDHLDAASTQSTPASHRGGRITLRHYQELLSQHGGPLATLCVVAGPGAQPWAHSTELRLAELASMEAAGTLQSGSQVILLSLAHTFHNRLGLGLRDDAEIASMLAKIGRK